MGQFLAIGTVIGYALSMNKILVSACLMGDPVRYDGAAKLSTNMHLARWRDEGRLLSFCPEVAGGFGILRLPAEIEADTGASDVLGGHARIIDSQGGDVTDGFLNGAQAALTAAQSAGCRHAILMDGSPSCGSSYIYAGHFDGTRKGGMGVTAALLVRNKIRVWNHNQIDALADALDPK